MEQVRISGIYIIFLNVSYCLKIIDGSNKLFILVAQSQHRI